MSKTFLLVSALLIGGAAFASSAQTAWTAQTESAAAARKACEQDATRQHVGKQRSRFIRQCLAKRNRPQGKDVARPVIQPSDPFAMPHPAPLRRSSRSGTMSGTLPSNAPVAPSTPVIGSSGTSTTGSSATSISGSSGTSIGGMR